jgi:hypothetical protein
VIGTLKSWNRDSLVGKRVTYRTRWSDDLRSGTIGRITANVIWIGCHCFHHNDLADLNGVN